MIRYQFHPLSHMLPLMREPDFSELVADIKENGQLLPIGIYEGKILDGRNRFLVCQKLGIEGKFVKLTPKDAKAYVTSINVHRRHLTREEKREHLLRLIAQQESLQMTDGEVAKAADVSRRTVLTEKEKCAKKGGSAHLSEKKRKKLESSKDGDEPEVIVDDAGVAIPEGAAQAYWARKPEAMNVLNQIRAAKGQVKKLEPADVMWSNVNLNGVMSDLENAANRFTAAIPAYVCPYCKGEKPENCRCCKGKGVISKFTWSTIPEEIRKSKGGHPF